MNDTLIKVARTGYAAKGTVYAIAGVLTFMAAFNMGGQKTSKLQVLEFLDKQPLGNVLLIFMALGLVCYSIWRFIQSLNDPENIGDDKKGKTKRFAYFISALIYLSFAVLAFLKGVDKNSPDSGGSGQGQQSHFLATDKGLILLGFIGVVFIITGIYKFFKLKDGKFLENFNLKSMSEEKRRKTIKNSGYIGIASRGVVFLIIGFFAVKAALNGNPSQMKTTSEVFAFLQDASYGPWLLGLVALGFIGYAIYMFMTAKYRTFRGSTKLF